MKNMLFAGVFGFFCLNAQAVTYDKREELAGVTLETGKESSTRYYRATTTKTFDGPLAALAEAVTTFTDKCNNGHKGKRKLTDKDVDCKFHVEELVETKSQRLEGEGERYLLSRNVYRRGSYAHHELAEVTKGKNSMGQDTVTVTLKMLTDDEARALGTVDLKTESDFTARSETYVLTDLSDKRTELRFELTTATEHWLLNKQLLVPQVFSSLSHGTTDVVKAMEDASTLDKRTIASHK